MKTNDQMQIHSESRRLYEGCPKTVPMALLNEEWAKRNHDQSLGRLNERGGMGVMEILDNIHRRRLSFGTKETKEHFDELMKYLESELPRKAPVEEGGER